MQCKCNNEMMELARDYNGYEDLVGIYSYCKRCGRVHYYDISLRRFDQPDCSPWIEPEYLEEKTK
jgi:hypothetical protein